jgi:dephospho-CoA kinase
VLDVILVALTGGIGSGKSSVSRRLADRGAVIVDADASVRELQEPGRPVFDAMVERWGDRVVSADGGLDRAAMAGIVFGDSEESRAELKALEAIVHPAVRADMAEQISKVATADRSAASTAGGRPDTVVVQDLPLMVEWGGGRRGTSGVIVVDVPVELAIERLVTHRGFSRADVEARIASQAAREDRLALADFVIDNSGTLQDLDAEVERCWNWILDLDPTPWPPPDGVPL